MSNAETKDMAATPKEMALARFKGLRDSLKEKESGGVFKSVAASEWKGLPLDFRMFLLLLAGVGEEEFDAKLRMVLLPLARRNWESIPKQERDGIRSVARRVVQMARPRTGQIKDLARWNE